MSDLADVARDARIKTLEADVTTLKLDVSKIGMQIETMNDRAEERHNVLSTQQIRMMDLLEAREKESREFPRRAGQRALRTYTRTVRGSTGWKWMSSIGAASPGSCDS